MLRIPRHSVKVVDKKKWRKPTNKKCFAFQANPAKGFVSSKGIDLSAEWLNSILDEQILILRLYPFYYYFIIYFSHASFSLFFHFIGRKLKKYIIQNNLNPNLHVHGRWLKFQRVLRSSKSFDQQGSYEKKTTNLIIC